MRLYIGGSNGLHLYEDGDLTELSTEEILCVARTGTSQVVAGTENGSIVSWKGNGTHIAYKGLGDSVSSLGAAADSTLYAGTLPAGLWVSKDGGDNWKEIESFNSAPGSEDWDAPWGTPLASAVGIHPKSPRTIYLGVEVGGIYRTRDLKKWYDLGIPVSDVHSIQISPARFERIYVTTSGGAFCSDDEGFNWRKMGTSNRRQYAMGLAAHPVEVDRVIISGADGPPPTWRGKTGAKCDIYLSTDAGKRFRTVVKDLKGGVERKALVINPKVPSEVAFGTSVGEIFYSNDGGESFDRFADKLGHIHTILFA